MPVISEIPDDSNGGDKNKKRKEEENRNKKLKGTVLSSLPIPEELTLSCLAMIQRCHYPIKLSLVSKTFRRLIASPELYADRSTRGCTESVLYALVRFPPSENPKLYILNRKPYRNTILLKLGEIDSLPPMPFGSSVVTIGPEIYVIGGCHGDINTSDVILIDCRSHTWRSLPRMNVARRRAAAGVIDGKIYVIGGCEMRSLNWIEVFDPAEQNWSGKLLSFLPDVSTEFKTYAVMEEKIYISDKRFCYTYEPKEDQWKSLRINKLSFRWEAPYCVIDDLLFCNNQVPYSIKTPIYVYDLKENTWRPLRGLQGFPANIILRKSQMADFGGKLVVLGCNQCQFSKKYDGKKEIWCVEIGLERREGGEIWGKVEAVDVVHTVLKFPCVEICPTVTL